MIKYGLLVPFFSPQLAPSQQKDDAEYLAPALLPLEGVELMYVLCMCVCMYVWMYYVCV